MKRKCIILLILVWLTALYGCGQDESENTKTESKNETVYNNAYVKYSGEYR